MNDFYIDINCDVGEGIGNEAELMPLISSCNIACGGHAGDENSMKRTIKLAQQHCVLVGGHPSYPDRQNFGRMSMDIDAGRLIRSIRSQINSLVSILQSEGESLHHIKPHGALYNDLVKNKELALAFLEAIEKFKTMVSIYTPYGSVLAQEAIKNDFKLVYEAFADRNYNQDLSLVSRKLPNALIQEPKEVLEHLVRMVKEKMVMTVDGKLRQIVAETYCLHGDTPHALRILMYLSENLAQQNIHIKK